MALQLNNGNISMIQNPVFAAYAKSYQNVSRGKSEYLKCL